MILFIIREALNNAIAHQDYSCHGMINVIETEDRLLFTNLGSFIPDSIKSVLTTDAPEERYRNKFLVGAMVELYMVDTIGIKKECSICKGNVCSLCQITNCWTTR